MARRLREIRYRQQESVERESKDDSKKTTIEEFKATKEEAQNWKEKAKKIYFTEYKKLIIIPIVILILSLIQIGYQIATTGDFINKGVSLRGGATISFTAAESNINLLSLQEELKAETSNGDIIVRKIGSRGVIIEAGVYENEELQKLIDLIQAKTGIEKSQYSIEIMGSTLGKSFFRQAFLAMIIAFALMAIVVFVIFRTFVPSIAVILAAFSDIVITIAFVNLMGIKVSTAGIAAFLMLIGYSVDTDILLTIRVLKRKEGSVEDRIIISMKTGLTMTVTAMASAIVVLIFSKSEVLTQIMTILLIGLIADIINTWIQNVGILKWYLEKKQRGVEVYNEAG
ncbi:MAG: protein translocase subunit SecF [Candidatus Woesearchaeota archaeon]